MPNIENSEFDNAVLESSAPLILSVIAHIFIGTIDPFVLIAHVAAFAAVITSFITKKAIYIIVAFSLLILALIVVIFIGFDVSGSAGGKLIGGAIIEIIWLGKCIFNVAENE